MNGGSRTLFALIVPTLFVCDLSAGTLPNYDAETAERTPSRAPFHPRDKDKAKIKAGTVVQMDERLGIPTLVWAAPASDAAGSTPSVMGLGSEAAARRHLL